MNRRLALMLTGSCLLFQTMWLALLPSLLDELERVGRADAGFRLAGLREATGESFALRPGTVAGWVPQVTLVVVSVLLAYKVFRGAREARPRLRTVGAFGGALLLAAGIAELLVAALDTDGRRPGQAYLDWFAEIGLQGPAPTPALVIVWAGLFTLLVWMEVWLARRLLPLWRELAGAEDEGPRAEPVLLSPRERRDAVVAGLIPVVLLSLAGGLLLRHHNVHASSGPSLTFDPEQALPYEPPPLAEAWRVVLYPALRMRPLPTENTDGWLATLAICLVLLAVLALALRAVVQRAGTAGRLRVFARCWYATMLAAAVAALVESVLMQGHAPLPHAQGLFSALTLSLADAVRFGTVCGWLTGAAVVGAVALQERRRPHSDQPHTEKGELSDAG